MMTGKMPKLAGVLDTTLFVDDLERARKFYERVLALKPTFADGAKCIYPIIADTFMLHKRRAVIESVEPVNDKFLPPDSHGPARVAFAIDARELNCWETLLTGHGIAIEGRVRWPRGGDSLYFRDPDGDLLELATPGEW
jgi:catechol 2,3-dioxygenase-like lactoylglutathione lyase family enzyme